MRNKQLNSKLPFGKKNKIKYQREKKKSKKKKSLQRKKTRSPTSLNNALHVSFFVKKRILHKQLKNLKDKKLWKKKVMEIQSSNNN